MLDLYSTPLTNDEIFKIDPVYLAVSKDNSILKSILDKGIRSLPDADVRNIYDLWISEGLVPNRQIVLPISMSEDEQTFVRQNPILRVQLEEDWYPYNYTEQNSEKGLSNDYIKLIAQKIGISGWCKIVAACTR